MKQTKIYRMMAAVLIAAVSVGLTSCDKDKESEQDPLYYLWGWWSNYCYDFESDTGVYRWIEFKRDNTYTYEAKNETIDGMLKLSGIEKTTVVLILTEQTPDGNWIDVPYTVDAKLYKILASGSNAFDQMWVTYYQHKSNVNGINTEIAAMIVQFYSGNEEVAQGYTHNKYYRDPGKGIWY